MDVPFPSSKRVIFRSSTPGVYAVQSPPSIRFWCLRPWCVPPNSPVPGVYAALWPFLGILVECALLGVVIIIFEKRRQKQDVDESDTDQGNDQ